MRRRYLYPVLVIAVLQGGYMVADGLHVMITGSYMGNRVGPWALVVRSLGFNEFKVGPLFVVLGALWLLSFVLVLVRPQAGVLLLTLAAIASLFYLPFGTLLSVAALALLVPVRRELQSKPV